METRLDPRSVAVVGAGVSGVAAVIHLTRAGLAVTAYERSSQFGGIWCVEPSLFATLESDVIAVN